VGLFVIYFYSLMVAVFGAMKNIYTNYTVYLHPSLKPQSNQGLQLGCTKAPKAPLTPKG